jgi:HEAT repeat protein
MNDILDKHCINLRNEAWFVRSGAAESPGNLGDPRAIEPLVAALRDDNTWVRLAAREALDKIEPGWRGLAVVHRAVPDFIAALRAPNPEVRRDAVAILADIGDSRAVGPLVAALRDPDASVRQAAESTMDTINPDWFDTAVFTQLPDFIAALLDRDPHVYGTVANLLDKIDPAWPLSDTARSQVPDFIAALGDADLQRQASETLGKIGDIRAVPALVEVFRNQDEAACHAAASALKKIGKAAIRPMLAGLLDPHRNIREKTKAVLDRIDQDWPRSPAAGQFFPEALKALGSANMDVQNAAAELLGRMGDRRAVGPLIAEMANTHQEVLGALTQALGMIGDERAVRPLVGLLRHDSIRVRRGAVEAIGQIGGLAALEPLIEVLGDPDATVRASATEVLAKFGPIAIEPLLVALRFKESGVREMVLAVLARIDPQWPRRSSAQRHFAAFLEALENGNHHIRIASAKALGQIGDPRAVIPLAVALGYAHMPGCPSPEPARPNTNVQCAAAEALGQIGDAHAVRPLSAALKNPAEDPNVRCMAAKALGQIGDAHAALSLIAAASDDEPWQVQTAAKEALLALGPISMEPLLIAARDSNKRLHHTATELLKQFEPIFLTPLLDSHPHLLCSTCGLRSVKRHVRINLLHWKTVVVCRDCHRIYNLLPNVRHVIGIIGGAAGKDFEERDQIAYIRLWNEAAGVARNADIDRLIIREGGVADYGRALRVVTQTLNGDKSRPAHWCRNVPVLIDGKPHLTPETRELLRSEYREVS